MSIHIRMKSCLLPQVKIQIIKYNRIALAPEFSTRNEEDVHQQLGGCAYGIEPCSDPPVHTGSARQPCWGSCSYVSEASWCPLWGGSSLSLQPGTAQCSTSSRTTRMLMLQEGSDWPALTASHQGPPASGPGCSASPAWLSTEELPRVLRGGPRHFTTATSSEEEPPEEPGQMAAADSSVLGSTPKRGGPTAAPWTHFHHARGGTRSITTWHPLAARAQFRELQDQHQSLSPLLRENKIIKKKSLILTRQLRLLSLSMLFLPFLILVKATESYIYLHN